MNFSKIYGYVLDFLLVASFFMCLVLFEFNIDLAEQVHALEQLHKVTLEENK